MHLLFTDRAGAKSILDLMGHIAVACLAENSRVTFVLFDDGCAGYDYALPAGVDIYTLRVPPKKRLWDVMTQHLIFARGFRALLDRLKPDIVHTNFAVPSIVARWVAARAAVPCIVSTQHELYGSMSPHLRWGLRLTERYCSAIVYVSHAVARSFGRQASGIRDIEKGHKPAHVVIPNGVDLNKIRAVIADAPARVPGKLVCAGRMVPVKGQALLLHALPEVLKRHPHVKLMLIGSGPMEAALQRLAATLGLQDVVEFRGWLPHAQVLREMASAELVVVPSDGTQEGYGLVLAEALVCGTRLVVSDIPVFHEVLDRFPERVRFFARKDTSALGAALEASLSSDPAFPTWLAALNAEDVAHFSSEAMAAAYLQLYQGLPCWSHK